MPDTPFQLKYPAALDSLDSLGRVNDIPQTFLDGTISSGAATIAALDTSAFDSSGSIVIGNEQIYYTAKTSTTFTGCLRGRNGTAASTHTSGAEIRSPILAAHRDVLVDALMTLQGKVGIGSGLAAGAITGHALVKQSDGSTAWQSISGVTSFNTRSGDVVLVSADLNGLSGSGLTGIGSGTGGVINIGSTTIGADSDADGVGVVVLQTRGITRFQVNNDGTLIGSALTAQIMDKGGEVFNAQAYGWLPDNTDRSAQALALLALVSAAGGGTIYFPSSTGMYRADSQLFITNDGASPQPNQKNFRFTGAGGGHAWYGVNAAVLDLRYQASDGNAKIESRGTGTLQIDNLTIMDGGSANNTPFVHLTNTTPVIYGNTFIGTGAWAFPIVSGFVRTAQDAIVLGGATNNIDGSVTGTFQGYAPYIHGNHFSRLNRGLYARWNANAVTFTNNSFQGCSGTTAIEFDGAPDPGLRIYGLTVTGNSIEMDVYVYGITLNRTMGGYFSNSFYDGTEQFIMGVGQGNGQAAYSLTDSPGNQFYHLAMGEYLNQFVPFVGDTASLTTLTSSGGVPPQNLTTFGAYQQDALSMGNYNAEFGNGAVIRGNYNDHHNYNAQLVIAAATNKNKNLQLGYNNISGADYGFIQSITSAGVSGPLTLNPPVGGFGGFVGVGNIPTTALAAPLHVGVDGSGNAQRWGDTTNTNFLNLVVNGTDTIFGSSAARNFLLNNNSFNKIKLASNGDILINQEGVASLNRLIINTGGSGARIGDSADTNYLELIIGGSLTRLLNSGTRPLNVQVNAQDRLSVDNSSTANDTALLLWDVTAGILVRVTRGAADSGGAGFRLLRIPN